MSGLTRVRAFSYQATFRKPVRVGLSMRTHRPGWFLCGLSPSGEVWSEVAPLDGYGADSVSDVARRMDHAIAWLHATPLPASAADMPSSLDVLSGVPSLRWAVELLLAKAAALRDGQPLGVWLGASPHAIVTLAGLHSEGDHPPTGTVKLKVGSGSIDDDIEAVRQLGNRLEGMIRLDANRAWTVEEAHAFLDGIEPWIDRIAFLEEPLQDPTGLVELSAWSPVAIAVDESARDGVGDVPFHETGARVLVMKPSLHGGVSEVLTALRQAHDARMDVVFSSSYETAVGMEDLLHMAAVRPGLPAGFGTAGLLRSDFGPGWGDVETLAPHERIPQAPWLCPVRLAAWRTPDREAVRTDAGGLDWATLDATVDQAVRRLEESGLGPDSRVACLAEPSTDFLVLLFASMRLGMTLLPVSPRLPDAARKALIASVSTQWLDVQASTVESGVATRTRPYVHNAGGTILVATSGSTGAPKWIRHHWVNLCRHAREVNAHLGIGPGHVWGWSLPPHHVGGLSIPIRCAVAGAALSMASSSSPPSPGITHLSLVPAQLEALLNRSGQSTETKHACIVLGGGPCDRSLVERAAGHGWRVRTSYGMTETGSMVACSDVWTPATLASWPERTLHSGKALGSWRVHADDTGRLAVAGPLLGFTDTPSGPQPLGPIFRTSDAGIVDDEGHLVIAGRLDRVIISGGENIDLGVVEAALMSLPGMLSVRVVGTPSATYGVRPVAFVRATNTVWDRVDPAEALREALRMHIPGFMVPDRILPLPDLPEGELKWTDAALVAIASATPPPVDP